MFEEVVRMQFAESIQSIALEYWKMLDRESCR